jgi:hypothetical protein
MRSKTWWSPPIMNVSVPPSAPGLEPVQGASRKSTPFAASARPISRLALGAMVLASATTVPRRAPSIEAVLAQDRLARHGGVAHD